MRTPGRSLWVIGPGRAGLSLSLMLHRAGEISSLLLTGRSVAPTGLRLLRDRGLRPRYEHRLRLPGPVPSGVVVAVPDRAVREVAGELAALGLPRGTPVLHLSGSLGREALEPLARGGCSTGLLHPLCALPDPVRGAARLHGSWFRMDGRGPVRELALWMVAAAGGRVLSAGGVDRALYHAAATLASNGLVSLLSLAASGMEEAGLERDEAVASLASLADGVLDDLTTLGPEGALTGPVSRGDVETVRGHLARLPARIRPVYCLLGLEALRVARARGLEESRAVEVERLLTHA